MTSVRTYPIEGDYVLAFHTTFKGLLDDDARDELVDCIITITGTSKWTNVDKSDARENNKKLVKVLEKKGFIKSWQTIQDFAKDLKIASHNEKPNLSSLSDDIQKWLAENLWIESQKLTQHNQPLINVNGSVAEEEIFSELRYWLASNFIERGLLCDLFRWDNWTRSQIIIGNDQFILILRTKGIIDNSQSIRDFAKAVEAALPNRHFSDLTSLSDQLKATVAKLDKLKQI